MSKCRMVVGPGNSDSWGWGWHARVDVYRGGGIPNNLGTWNINSGYWTAVDSVWRPWRSWAIAAGRRRAKQELDYQDRKAARTIIPVPRREA